MEHFRYATGGAVVIQNISSCCSLYSFNFVTKCLLPGMPNWGTVLKLRTNICVIGCLFFLIVGLNISLYKLKGI